MTQNKKVKKPKSLSGRVDAQVLVMVVIFTLISCIVTSQLYWKYTLQVLMEIETQRAYALYTAIEDKLDPDTFLQINSFEDMETDLYKNGIQTLLDLKQSSGVLYLFTAKPTPEGDLVYVLDGLEPHLDFRYPYDLIEEEIEGKMAVALEGDVVMPKSILDTEWGYIFMAYLPFHDQNGEVIGVVGIEFDASESYYTYLDLKFLTFIMCLILTLMAGVLTVYLFRRITNPLYMDKHTKDTVTGMRNRNAYEVDLHNLNARGVFEGLGVVVADINGLKEVNDRLGHSAGDRYIELVAECIHQTKSDTTVSYRTGGDEFVIFVQDTNEADLAKFTDIFMSRVRSQKKYNDMRCSVACGFGIFDANQDNSLQETVDRVDERMYEEKRRQKEQQER